METQTTTLIIRIIGISCLVLGAATYPWMRRPWTNYAGSHTFGWLMIFTGALSILAVQADELPWPGLYSVGGIVVGS